MNMDLARPRSDYESQLHSSMLHLQAPPIANTSEARPRAVVFASPDSQYPILDPANMPSTSTGSAAPNTIADGAIDFSNIQFDDETFLEDVLLCQFTYNPSGLTVPSTPIMDPRPLTNLTDCLDDVLELDTIAQPSNADQRVNTHAHSTFQITANEFEIFHAKLVTAEIDGTLGRFKKPSLSRTLRCIIAYFRHFDPHAPFIHYASFSILTSHRKSWCYFMLSLENH